MEEFPSGQRGQTVNLLRLASMVRIHPPPPKKLRFLNATFFNISAFVLLIINISRNKNESYGGEISFMDKELALKFEKEMRKICADAKEASKKKGYNYNPIRFLQMLDQFGGVETAKRLIKKSKDSGRISDGFTRLAYELGRRDLTMEYVILKPEYSKLFTPEEIDYCKSVLGN